MRINPPPANLLPARLSNLRPVSARIGDRSDGLLESLALAKAICNEEIFVDGSMGREVLGGRREERNV